MPEFTIVPTEQVLVSKVKILTHSGVSRNSKKIGDHMIISHIRLSVSGFGLKRILDENTLLVVKIICTLRQAVCGYFRVNGGIRKRNLKTRKSSFRCELHSFTSMMSKKCTLSK